MQIRKATNQDKADIFALAHELATSFDVDESRFSQSFDKILKDKNIILLLAEAEGRALAYVLGYVHPAFYANGNIAWVEELFVDAPHRKSGVGKALMNAFEVSAKECDCQLISLATRRASSFYKAIGYEDSATYFKKVL